MLPIGTKVRVLPCAKGRLDDRIGQIGFVSNAWESIARVQFDDNSHCVWWTEIEPVDTPQPTQAVAPVPKPEPVEAVRLPVMQPATTGPRVRCRDCAHFDGAVFPGSSDYCKLEWVRAEDSKFDPIRGYTLSKQWSVRRMPYQKNANGRCPDFTPRLRHRIWTKLVSLATASW